MLEASRGFRFQGTGDRANTQSSVQRTFTKHILCAQTCLGPVTKSKFRHLPFGHYLQNRTAEAKKASDVLGKGNNTPAAPSLWKLV